MALDLGLSGNKKGEYNGPCPACCYRTGFSLSERAGKILFYCHAGGCTSQEIIQELQRRKLWRGSSAKGSHARAYICLKTPPSVSPDYLQKLFQQSFPATGTEVERYLKARGLTAQIPGSLRYLPKAKHQESGLYLPVMLGLVTDASGNFKAVHRTYLEPEAGRKASVKPDKKTLGPIQGFSVHLAPAGPILAVTEGIETGLTVQEASGIPTWAALSAGGMESLILPAETQEVIICADADTRGQQAAMAAAKRWASEGRRVKIACPPEAGQDFNDMLTAERS
jgi:phage/plasmid primase-like uncharacterized protein